MLVDLYFRWETGLCKSESLSNCNHHACKVTKENKSKWTTKSYLRVLLWTNKLQLCTIPVNLRLHLTAKAFAELAGHFPSLFRSSALFSASNNAPSVPKITNSLNACSSLTAVYSTPCVSFNETFSSWCIIFLYVWERTNCKLTLSFLKIKTKLPEVMKAIKMSEIRTNKNNVVKLFRKGWLK